MDYEVLLLSRIKEEYDRTGDNTVAVSEALVRCGPLVTAAAAVLAVSFTVSLSSGIGFVKMIGVGMALAVLVDAR